MQADSHDPVIEAFRRSYAVLADRAPFVDDDVVGFATRRPHRSAAWRALVAAAVVVAAVGAVAWLVRSDPQPEVLAVGAAPFEPDVVVFLRTDVGDAELASVAAAVEGHPAVRRVAFFSQADAYAEAQELFADDPLLLAVITPDKLPPSLRFEAPRQSWPALVRRLQTMDGVVTVVTADDLRAVRGDG